MWGVNMYTKTKLSIPIPEERLAIIVGTILGDASVTISRNKLKTACLRFTHSIKQIDYCSHKAEKLKFMVSPCGVATQKTKRMMKNGELFCSCRFSTKYTSELADFYYLFYPYGVKVIPDNIKDLLSAEALAYWYMDDGSIEKAITRRPGIKDYIGYRANFHTNGFSEKDCKVLSKALYDKFNLKFKLKKVEKGRHWILQTKSRSTIEQFFTIVRPFMIPSMMYKIKAEYSCKKAKYYSKEQLMRIVKWLNLKKCSDFLHFKRGVKIYDAVRYHFGSVAACWQDINQKSSQ